MATLTHDSLKEITIRLTRGVNHIAVLTDDLERFVEFYSTVFELEAVFTETTPPDHGRGCGPGSRRRGGDDYVAADVAGCAGDEDWWVGHDRSPMLDGDLSWVTH